MAGNSTVDLLSSNAVDDSTNHPTTKQSMSAALKRLHACDSQQLRSLCSSFGISKYRSQDILIVMSSLTQLSGYQLRSFSDICGIPYQLTNAEYAGVIKNQLLDSVSPLVEEGGMVNLQFTPKLSRQEISDISNMSIHINRLEALSRAQLIIFCKMFGVSRAKPKVQLVEELRLYLTSNPSAVTEDGVLIPGNEKLQSSNSSKKTLSKPMHLHR
ncbi:hypothetical protein BASA83_001615 [Batrachochytrium salamandrivorans]|nr:hypothetical protein BASA83_001615 [Batrachochytrium salamandrivorans]